MNVITENGFTFFLDDALEITRGGEGRIMLVKELPNTVAKIYFNPQNAISPQKIAELQVLDNQYFIKPKELIYSIDSNTINLPLCLACLFARGIILARGTNYKSLKLLK
ncbi:MAG: hypothetical protein MUE81_10135 [Thermoflexibacter sp.]|nr:hypothetical protein [Thermoflexibacter sp.]